MKNKSVLKWVIWTLAATFYFYEFVLRVSTSAMVPELMKSFDITASALGVLSAFFLYSYAPMQIPVGMLMDRYGIKRILSIAAIVCGLGALFFAISQYYSIACVGRAMIGLGSSFAFIAMVYVSSHWFAMKQRAFLIGIANSLAMLGASAGAGGVMAAIIKTLGWRETIILFGIFGVLLGIVVYYICKKDDGEHAVDICETKEEIHIWDSLKQIMVQKSTWINAIVASLFYITTTAFGGLWGLSFIQTSYGVSKEVAGYATSMIFLGWGIGGPLTGFLSDFIGKRKTAMRLGLLGTLFCLFPVIYFPMISISTVYVLLFLVGFFSSAELLSFSLAIELNSIRSKAMAAAFTNCIVSLGDSFIQPFVGFLLDYRWGGVMDNGIRFYSTYDYQIALSCLPIAMIIGFVLLFMVKEKASI
jgi:MFS family permease